MTAGLLKRLRELHGAATPGPWGFDTAIVLTLLNALLPLLDCAEALEKIARDEDCQYGFFPGGDPRKFSPDMENEPHEHEAHKEACRLWAEAEAAGKSMNPEEPAGKWLLDEEGKRIVHILRSGFGPGTYTYPTEAARIAQSALAALERMKP